MSSSEPQPYSTITVDEVAFTGNTGPVQAEAIPPFAYGPGLNPENFSTTVDAFVVGIHAVNPPVGSGNPQSRDSLIGFKILETGEYTDIEVPIFRYRPDIGPAQVFPPTPDGTTDIVGTLWHDVGLDYGATQGVIQIDGEVNTQASITDLDQNPNRDPIGVVPRESDWNFVGRRGPDTFDDSDNPRFGEAIDTAGDVIAAGAPLEDHSTDVGSTYVLNGIFEELEPGEAGLDDQIEEGAQFGSSVAYDNSSEQSTPEELLVVGAPNDNEGAGAVYMFESGSNENSSWSLLKKINGKSPGDDFGAAVDVNLFEPGGFALVGAPNAEMGKGQAELIPIGGLSDADSPDRLPLPRPDTLGENAKFGTSVVQPSDSIFGPYFVGAPDAEPTEVGGATGAAYLFDSPEDGSPTRLTPEVATSSGFGSAVDLVRDDDNLLLAVGAPGRSDRQGEAALFEYEDFFGESPSLEKPSTFIDSDGSPGDRLGAAVEFTSNQKIVAGAPGGGYATLFNEFVFDDVAGHFTRPGDVSSFGTSVAAGPGRVVIGAPDANGSGRVYIYEQPSEDGAGGPTRLT